MSGNMLDRFEGEQGRRRLEELLRGHAVLCCDAEAIREIAAAATLRDLAASDILIRQDEADNDLFFILSGVVRIFVNGREVAQRKTGQHVGEMAVVDPAARRTSTVIASAETLVAKVDEATFRKIADRNPRIWQAVAVELCRRLDERRKFHATPNAKPILFIGSSKEQLALAQAIARGVPEELAGVKLWSEGVFTASSFALDDLETQLGISDFALLVASGDDQVISREKQSAAPRDNVIFELGLFIGALSRGRTFLLKPRGSEVKIPSDLLGMQPIQYDPAAGAEDAARPVLAELIGILEKMSPK